MDFDLKMKKLLLVISIIICLYLNWLALKQIDSFFNLWASQFKIQSYQNLSLNQVKNMMKFHGTYFAYFKNGKWYFKRKRSEIPITNYYLAFQHQ